MEKLKIYVTPAQAEWCKRHLDFDPYETEGYIVEEECK